jgi:hypothetical protein
MTFETKDRLLAFGCYTGIVTLTVAGLITSYQLEKLKAQAAHQTNAPAAADTNVYDIGYRTSPVEIGCTRRIFIDGMRVCDGQFTLHYGTNWTVTHTNDTHGNVIVFKRKDNK